MNDFSNITLINKKKVKQYARNKAVNMKYIGRYVHSFQCLWL